MVCCGYGYEDWRAGWGLSEVVVGMVQVVEAVAEGSAERYEWET